MGVVLLLCASSALGSGSLERWVGFPLTCEACRPGNGYIYCAVCQGKGLIADPCGLCQGTGQRSCPRCVIHRPFTWPGGIQAGWIPCEQCQGSGARQVSVFTVGTSPRSWYEDRRCAACAARGWIPCNVCNGKGAMACPPTRPAKPCHSCWGKRRRICPACLHRLGQRLSSAMGDFLAGLVEPGIAMGDRPPILEGEASAGRLLPPPRPEDPAVAPERRRQAQQPIGAPLSDVEGFSPPTGSRPVRASR